VGIKGKHFSRYYPNNNFADWGYMRSYDVDSKALHLNKKDERE